MTAFIWIVLYYHYMHAVRGSDLFVQKSCTGFSGQQRQIPNQRRRFANRYTDIWVCKTESPFPRRITDEMEINLSDFLRSYNNDFHL